MQQAFGIAAVQADGGLVEHVAGSHEPRAETSGELDALRFTAGERGREPVERQVFEADIVEELETLLNLDEDLACDAGFFGSELEV